MIQSTRVRISMNRGSLPQTSFLGRFLALTITGLLLGGALVAAVAFSLIVLPVILLVGAIAAGYLWWRTRGVRRQFKEQMEAVQAQMARQQAGATGPAPGGPARPGASHGRGEGVVIEGDDLIHEAKPRRPGV